ncbi:MAG: 2-oxoacid:acceptor oxidoreductase family protein [Proteobacteria bacterium]|nr:2-oxoacid:acceptor oxidoreductase family protein [Pseudomonadota bacterium]MCH8177162.1 2-oxoacid:acceptor oxidoreductase family protein [Pseudomonadota bacterium]MDK1024946.1 2-oxoacid:acceptor oxidoreductase family protein [Gammaproteobacteria bacterium]
MSETQIRLSGSGGQGLQLAARILVSGLALEGRNISLSQSYEPTSRGGLSRSDLVVGSSTGYPLVSAIDYLVILDQIAVENSLGLIKNDSTVIVDSERVDSPPDGAHTTISLALIQTAREIGNVRAANVVSLGVLAGLSGICSQKSLLQAIRDTVPARFIDLNLEALARGYALVSAEKSKDTQLTAVS